MPYPLFNPYSQYPQPNQYQPPIQASTQPVHGFVFVQGIEGARAYYLPNNSEMPLFDNDENIMYIKKVDATGRMTIEVKDVFDHVDKPRDDGGEYVTRNELSALYAEIDTLRSAISQKPAHAKE